MESFVDSKRTSVVRATFFVCTFLSFFLPAALDPWAQEPSAQQGGVQDTEEPIDVVADALSVGDRGQTIEASGNVQIRRADTTFEAESVKIDRASQELEAVGSVSVDGPQ